MDTRKKAVRRLKIISGQINALLVMIENEEDCEKVFPQVKAVKSAFSGFSSEIMKGMMTECLTKSMNEGDSSLKSQEKLERLIERFTSL